MTDGSGGIGWTRPPCPAGNCPYAMPDNTAWVLPFSPALPGQTGSDCALP